MRVRLLLILASRRRRRLLPIRPRLRRNPPLLRNPLLLWRRPLLRCRWSRRTALPGGCRRVVRPGRVFGR